jgi:hypothetical protein
MGGKMENPTAKEKHGDKNVHFGSEPLRKWGEAGG